MCIYTYIYIHIYIYTRIYIYTYICINNCDQALNVIFETHFFTLIIHRIYFSESVQLIAEVAR